MAKAKRVVIKVGSALLARSPAARPAAIAEEVCALLSRDVEVVLVSSGAISLGCKILGFATRPTDLPRLQAAAAVGQSQLMQHWEHGFRAHQKHTAQVLITHHDMADRSRFLNARHALRALLSAGAVPIVNENDTVAVDEIKYGDNDLLAALVANLVGADALIILTDVNGLHDAPPDQGGQRIPIVRNIDTEAVAVAGGTPKGGFGSGGMASKVQAAKAAGQHGVITVVVLGDQSRVIQSAVAGDDIGTLFVPGDQRMTSRKHWLAYGPRPAGTLVVDSGAGQALKSGGKSLLPAGILEVQGDFSQGDIVSLVTPEGTEFARGLACYGAADMRKVQGLHSSEIELTLGYKYVDELIHRDDLVLLS